MDEELEQMTRDELVSEVKKLRQGIREHRDSTKHELCWHHPALWGLLPEKTDPVPTVPAWPEFMEGCIQYRRSLDQQLPGAPRTHKRFHDSVSKEETQSLVLINPFEVPNGLEEEALAYWERCADVLRSQPGFISTCLHRAISPDARFALINVAKWASAEQFYEAVSKPEFQAVAVEDAKKYPHSPALYEVVRDYERE
jgi:heme-degrading monooxygenase HmoA